MTTAKNLLIITSFTLLTSYVLSQENGIQKIKLDSATCERIANYAVWRTDYYICTGIFYAKSHGETVEDFAIFVTNAHAYSIERMRGK